MSNCKILAWKYSLSKTIETQITVTGFQTPGITLYSTYFHRFSIHFLHTAGTIGTAVFEPVKIASRHVLCLVLTHASVPHENLRDIQKRLLLHAHTFTAVSVWCPLCPALSNQSPLSQAAPRWVLQRNNERTVAEYFIPPAPSVPTLFASWDWGPVLLRVWLLWCSSFMGRASNWAHSSGRVDFCPLCFHM